MSRIFAPGCALMLYKPHLVEQLSRFLGEHHQSTGRLLTCCRHTPQVPEGTEVVNVCPGCDKRYRNNNDNPLTVSLWEVLEISEASPFPDYGGRKMTINDACPTRNQDRIHLSVRTVAAKMNISVVEPDRTKRKGTCCGDTFFGKLPTEQVVARMRRRTNEMPAEEVLVYCVSCANPCSMEAKDPGILSICSFQRRQSLAHLSRMTGTVSSTYLARITEITNSSESPLLRTP